MSVLKYMRRVVWPELVVVLFVVFRCAGAVVDVVLVVVLVQRY